MFKKLMLLAVLVFSLSATCFAAKLEEGVSSSRIYQDSEYKISVQLPEGFDYVYAEGEDVVVAAEDGKGGYYQIVAVDADPSQAAAGTNKKKLRDVKDDFRKEYLNNGMKLYSEYTVKINPDRYGYFMEGFTQGSGDSGKVKNAVIKFFHNDKLFTVTLRAPYDKKSYLRNFKRFRSSITCKY